MAWLGRLLSTAGQSLGQGIKEQIQFQQQKEAQQEALRLQAQLGLESELYKTVLQTAGSVGFQLLNDEERARVNRFLVNFQAGRPSDIPTLQGAIEALSRARSYTEYAQNFFELWKTRGMDEAFLSLPEDEDTLNRLSPVLNIPGGAEGLKRIQEAKQLRALRLELAGYQLDEARQDLALKALQLAASSGATEPGAVLSMVRASLKAMGVDDATVQNIANVLANKNLLGLKSAQYQTELDGLKVDAAREQLKQLGLENQEAAVKMAALVSQGNRDTAKAYFMGLGFTEEAADKLAGAALTVYEENKARLDELRARVGLVQAQTKLTNTQADIEAIRKGILEAFGLLDAATDTEIKLADLMAKRLADVSSEDDAVKTVQDFQPHVEALCRASGGGADCVQKKMDALKAQAVNTARNNALKVEASRLGIAEQSYRLYAASLDNFLKTGSPAYLQAAADYLTAAGKGDMADRLLSLQNDPALRRVVELNQTVMEQEALKPFVERFKEAALITDQDYANFLSSVREQIKDPKLYAAFERYVNAVKTAKRRVDSALVRKSEAEALVTERQVDMLATQATYYTKLATKVDYDIKAQQEELRIRNTELNISRFTAFVNFTKGILDNALLRIGTALSGGGGGGEGGSFSSVASSLSKLKDAILDDMLLAAANKDARCRAALQGGSASLTSTTSLAWGVPPECTRAVQEVSNSPNPYGWKDPATGKLLTHQEAYIAVTQQMMGLTATGAALYSGGTASGTTNVGGVIAVVNAKEAIKWAAKQLGYDPNAVEEWFKEGYTPLPPGSVPGGSGAGGPTSSTPTTPTPSIPMETTPTGGEVPAPKGSTPTPTPPAPKGGTGGGFSSPSYVDQSRTFAADPQANRTAEFSLARHFDRIALSQDAFRSNGPLSGLNPAQVKGFLVDFAPKAAGVAAAIIPAEAGFRDGNPLQIKNPQLREMERAFGCSPNQGERLYALCQASVLAVSLRKQYGENHPVVMGIKSGTAIAGHLYTYWFSPAAFNQGYARYQTTDLLKANTPYDVPVGKPLSPEVYRTMFVEGNNPAIQNFAIASRGLKSPNQIAPADIAAYAMYNALNAYKGVMFDMPEDPRNDAFFRLVAYTASFLPPIPALRRGQGGTISYTAQEFQRAFNLAWNYLAPQQRAVFGGASPELVRKVALFVPRLMTMELDNNVAGR